MEKENLTDVLTNYKRMVGWRYFFVAFPRNPLLKGKIFLKEYVNEKPRKVEPPGKWWTHAVLKPRSPFLAEILDSETLLFPFESEEGVCNWTTKKICRITIDGKTLDVSFEDKGNPWDGLCWQLLRRLYALDMLKTGSTLVSFHLSDHFRQPVVGDPFILVKMVQELLAILKKE